ncbi:trypsin-3-like [Ctenocephalides felis]|uniref:trypsin-3-like n=1 Tax=Ctenocephalides felis TaxID=7515 RepID=UPI000E6E43BD|nr:trypsin-3-like [Ctenocephalides felis]
MEVFRYFAIFFIVLFSGSESKNLTDSRMIGGKPADISELPYVASVLYRGDHICGGVIVSRYFVLTAAQCFKNVRNEKQVQVRVGSFRAYYAGIIVDANFYLLHPDFDTNFTSFEHDVALIRLSYPLRFDDNIQPATVADYGEQPLAGTSAVVAGWERFETRLDMAGDLRKINVSIVDEFDCFLFYIEEQEFTKYQLCASSSKKHMGACKGDVGSPLAVDGLIVGLYSWSGKCGDPEKPEVYSNLAEYFMWIDHSIKIFT